MDVVGTDNLSGGFERNINSAVNFVIGDLRELAFVESLWEQGPFDFIYHLAAYAAENRSHHVRAFNYDTNLISSVHLINMAMRNRVKCFVFTSSIAVYGHKKPPMTEEMVPAPVDPYGIAKYAVELDLRCALRMFGLPYIIFRPHNVYGERQNIWDKDRNVIGIFMRQLMNGEPMTIFGDGAQTRAFTYIGDIAPTIAESPLFVAARNQVFNLGSDDVLTVIDLARLVAMAMGKEFRVQHLQERQEVVHASCGHEKAKRIFRGFTTTPLSEGLQRMSKWATAVSL